MDEPTKDRIFVAGKGSEYAQAIMELLQERQTDIFVEMSTPKSGEDLVRIQGAFNEINYLMGRITSAHEALQADAIIETEYPEETGEENTPY